MKLMGTRVCAVVAALLGTACEAGTGGSAAGCEGGACGQGEGADGGTGSQGAGQGGAGQGGAGSQGAGQGGAGQGGAGQSGAGPVPTIEQCAIFPADNPWNTDISALPVHPNSDAFIDSIGRNGTLHPDFGTEWEGAPIGIPFVVVGADQPLVPVSFTWDDESDPGPYPVPSDAPIEGGADSDGDRHIIVVSTATCTLYELYNAWPAQGGGWTADAGAVFDLSSNALRPAGWTSADAAGLPILPGLVRYDEVAAGAIRHALRFTVSSSQRAYVSPATHAASSSTDPALPPMGLRLRMKGATDCSGLSTEVQVICAALKTYGMLVADNGSDWYISGAPDPRWSDDALHDLKSIPGDAFEVVDTGAITPY